MKLLPLTQMQMQQLGRAALKKPQQRASMQRAKLIIEEWSPEGAYVRMYVCMYTVFVHVCIYVLKYAYALFFPPPASPPTRVFFFFSNFLISKIWRIFPKQFSKISPIYTSNFFLMDHFFSIFWYKKIGEFFQNNLAKLVQFALFFFFKG
jgi:hypothetical protein